MKPVVELMPETGKLPPVFTHFEKPMGHETFYLVSSLGTINSRRNIRSILSMLIKVYPKLGMQHDFCALRLASDYHPHLPYRIGQLKANNNARHHFLC
jgi:hypothetical protein